MPQPQVGAAEASCALVLFSRARNKVHRLLLLLAVRGNPPRPCSVTWSLGASSGGAVDRPRADRGAHAPQGYHTQCACASEHITSDIPALYHVLLASALPPHLTLNYHHHHLHPHHQPPPSPTPTIASKAAAEATTTSDHNHRQHHRQQQPLLTTDASLTPPAVPCPILLCSVI